MYGVDLTTRVKVEDTAIPTLLTQCIEHIEKTGEWIYSNLFMMTARCVYDGSTLHVYLHFGYNSSIFCCCFYGDYMMSYLQNLKLKVCIECRDKLVNF